MAPPGPGALFGASIARRQLLFKETDTHFFPRPPAIILVAFAVTASDFEVCLQCEGNGG
jgi:hypothetical protein